MKKPFANTNKEKSAISEIEICKILPNPEQPRTVFDPIEMQELADSISSHGVIQPITVEPAGENYILHDGERRTRAATMAGLTKIPARIANKESTKKQLELALVANVQRADMHPIEEARAYERLNKEFGLDFHQIAKSMGKHYTYIMSRMGLLKLELPVQELILSRQIISTNEQTINALLSLPSHKIQIQMAQGFAEKNSSASVIIQVCRQYNTVHKMQKSKPSVKKLKLSPAVELISRNEPTKWNALQQLGMIPPWMMFAKQVQQTCIECPLAEIAGDATCSDCGLVAFVRNMIREASNA